MRPKIVTTYQLLTMRKKMRIFNSLKVVVWGQLQYLPSVPTDTSSQQAELQWHNVIPTAGYFTTASLPVKHHAHLCFEAEELDAHPAMEEVEAREPCTESCRSLAARVNSATGSGLQWRRQYTPLRAMIYHLFRLEKLRQEMSVTALQLNPTAHRFYLWRTVLQQAINLFLDRA